MRDHIRWNQMSKEDRDRSLFLRICLDPGAECAWHEADVCGEIVGGDMSGEELERFMDCYTVALAEYMEEVCRDGKNFWKPTCMLSDRGLSGVDRRMVCV